MRRADRTVLAALAASVILFAAALVAWAIALVSSWNTECPGGGFEPTGLDKGGSLWPPGAGCFNAQGHSYIYEAVPSLQTLVVALLALSVAMLVAGVVAGTIAATRPSESARGGRVRVLPGRI